MTMLFTTVAYASASSSFEANQKDNLMNELKELETKYSESGLEIIELDEKDKDRELLNFDSVEEFEQFIAAISASEINSFSLPDNPVEMPKTGDYQLNYVEGDTWENTSHYSEWAPLLTGGLLTGVACWKNIDYTYLLVYRGGRWEYQDVYNISSYISGISIAWWEQTSTSRSFSESNQVTTVKASGRVVFGIAIKDIPIGAIWPQTWEVTKRLTS